MKMYIKLIIRGMASGSLIFVVMSIFGIYFGGNYFSLLLTTNFISYSIASMIIGVGFSLPSIVYENNRLSFLNQFLIHITVGMIVYIATGLYVGWIPIQYGFNIIVLYILIALAFTFLIWFGFYLYYKKESLDINKQIKKIQNKQ